jgi:hypothetical protein
MAGESCSEGAGPLSAPERREFFVDANIFGVRVIYWSRRGARCSVDPSSPGRRPKWPNGLARSAIGVRLRAGVRSTRHSHCDRPPIPFHRELTVRPTAS